MNDLRFNRRTTKQQKSALQALKDHLIWASVVLDRLKGKPFASAEWIAAKHRELRRDYILQYNATLAMKKGMPPAIHSEWCRRVHALGF